MRLLHVSDWHLGKPLGRCDRRADVEDVLEQTVVLAETHAVDVVLHTGDLFDHARPRVEDLSLAVATLRRLARTAPVVVLAGNHDSPALFRFLDGLVGERITFVDKARPPQSGGILDLALGAERLRIAPLPFVHANRYLSDFVEEDPDRWTMQYADRIRRLQDALHRGLLDGHDPGRDVLVFAAHLHLTGAQVTRSERRLHVTDGYAAHREALPPVAYAALGHIHRAQRLPGVVEARYAGSPLPLDFGEEDDVKGCVLVEAAPGAPPVVTELPYTIRRPLRRLRGTLAEIAVAAAGIGEALVQVVVETDVPEPDLAARVAELLPQATLLDVTERVLGRQAIALDDDGSAGAPEAAVLEGALGDLFAEYLAFAGTDHADVDFAAETFRLLVDAEADAGEAEADAVLPELAAAAREAVAAS